MFAPDFELTRLDSKQWHNWWQLLVPPAVYRYDNWGLFVVDGTKVIETNFVRRSNSERSIAASLGAAPNNEDDHSVGSLEFNDFSQRELAAVAEKLKLSAIIVLDKHAITRFSQMVEPKLSLEQDIAEQGLIALAACKQLAGTALWTYPDILGLLPVPSFPAVKKTFDLLVPDRSAVFVYVIDEKGKRVHASFVAVKEGGDFVVGATHQAIDDLVPAARFASAWSANVGRINSAIEERFAKPSIGMFITLEAWRRVIAGPGDQLGRELNNKQALFDPAPAWLLGLLGSATVAAVAGRGARTLASFLPTEVRQRASAFATRAQSAMHKAGAHPFAMLGFDPIELWKELKHFYRES